MVSFYRRNHQPRRADVVAARDALAAKLSFVAEPTPIFAEHSLLRRLADHTRSVVTRRPYTYYEYGSRLFADALVSARELASFDLVHMDSLDLLKWLEQLPRPIAVTHHSIESELLRLRADVISNPLLSRYLRLQAALVEKTEKALCPWVDLNVMMSDTDASRLEQLAPGAFTATVPNGVDVDFFQPLPEDLQVGGLVNFLGPTYMLPNRDALDFFLEQIWPLIRRRAPEAQFEVIGKCPPTDKERFERHPAVRCLGFVEDLQREMARAMCCVVPIRVGGGTRLKILDAWAMGKAVVSTARGCEGLETQDGQNILIRDEPEDFAAAVLAVLSDARLRRRLGSGARRTAEEVYSWERIGAKLRSHYRALMD